MMLLPLLPVIVSFPAPPVAFWMLMSVSLTKSRGHATLSTTTFYLDAVGEDEQSIASRIDDCRNATQPASLAFPTL